MKLDLLFFLCVFNLYFILYDLCLLHYDVASKILIYLLYHEFIILFLIFINFFNIIFKINNFYKFASPIYLDSRNFGKLTSLTTLIVVDIKI